MSSVAVFTNLAVVVFTSDLLEDESTLTKVILFVAAEVWIRAPPPPPPHPPPPFYDQHGVFALRYLLSLLPNKPKTVVIQLQRQKIIRSKLIDELPDDFDDNAEDVHVAVDYTIFDHDVDNEADEHADATV